MMPCSFVRAGCPLTLCAAFFRRRQELNQRHHRVGEARALQC
jgi:hypothetical protein